MLLYWLFSALLVLISSCTFPLLFCALLCYVFICSSITICPLSCVHNVGCRWMFLEMIKNVFQWICLCMLELFLEIVFWRYRCGLYVLSVWQSFPGLVMHILYHLSWQLWLLLSSMVPWVHSPLSSHWTATVDPMGRETRFLKVSLFCLFLHCLSTNALWCSSSLSVPIGGLFFGIMPLTGWLDNNVAGLQRPCLSSVVLICSRAMCMSFLELTHFIIVHFINLMHASTCPLLWLWYEDDTTCSIFRFLQKFLNFPQIKLPPASNIIVLGIPCSENTTLNAAIKLSADSPSVFFTTTNLLW